VQAPESGAAISGATIALLRVHFAAGLPAIISLSAIHLSANLDRSALDFSIVVISHHPISRYPVALAALSN
jgi:hypothetical protein